LLLVQVNVSSTTTKKKLILWTNAKDKYDKAARSKCHKNKKHNKSFACPAIITTQSLKQYVNMKATSGDLEQHLIAQAHHDAMSASGTNAPVDLDDDEGDENAKIFPQRLMEILTNPDNQEAIAWLPHGKAFIIVNRQKFADNVLPHYFRKTKYTSFTRKLNRWNFTRVTRGAELGAYYHEFFQRGSEAMCTQMYCKNERAKFAVAGKEGKKPAAENEHEPVPVVETPVQPAQPAAVHSSKDLVRHMSTTDFLQLNNMMTKPHMPTMDPAVQTRMHLLGGMHMRSQDPAINAAIDQAMHALQQQNNGTQRFMQHSSPAAMLRLQQFAAMQQQPKAPTLNYYRASAA
jgi:hypothetical protein